MGITRYQLIQLTPRGPVDHIFEVVEVKMADTTRPGALLDVAMRMARHWSDRNHDVRFAVLPYWDGEADVCDQDTVALNEELIHTRRSETLPAAVQVSEIHEAPDVSEIVTSLLSPHHALKQPLLPEPKEPIQESKEPHDPDVEPIRRIVRPHRGQVKLEGEGA